MVHGTSPLHPCVQAELSRGRTLHNPHHLNLLLHLPSLWFQHKTRTLLAVPLDEPVASPVPLAAASFLSFSSKVIPDPAQIVDTPLFTPNETDQPAMDLTTWGISELNDIINSQTDPYVTQPDGLNLLLESSQPALTPNTQAETEKLLASLNDLSQPPAQPQEPTGTTAAEGDVEALLASLQSQAQPDEGYAFDFQDLQSGEVDLSELVGLFSQPTSPQPRERQEIPVLAEQQTRREGGVMEDRRQPEGVQTDNQQEIDAFLSGAGDDPVFDGGGSYDMGIDLDDFNFNDGQMPNVEGDEFEELFAEFK